jgi:hypothetical protein
MALCAKHDAPFAYNLAFDANVGNDCSMTPEQRQRIIEILHSGDEIAPKWSRILFPPEKREYELVYHGKEREEGHVDWIPIGTGCRAD